MKASVNNQSICRWCIFYETKCLALEVLVVEFALLVGRGILVLLVLGDEVVHVGLGLGEFHLVHTLARVPVEECLASEHDRELWDRRGTYEYDVVVQYANEKQYAT